MKRVSTYISLVLFLMIAFFPATIYASTVEEIVIEGGLIEWGEGYLKVSEGFELWVQGQHLVGDEIFLDLKSNIYLLEQTAFTPCMKENPHYLLRAKRVRIRLEDQITFSDVQLVVGGIEIPFLADLTLAYKDGKYQLPEQLPRIMYRGDQGIGLGLAFSRELLPQLRAKGNVAIFTSGHLETELEGNYLINNDFTLKGAVQYNEYWRTKVDLNWREKRPGLRVKGEWNWTERGANEQKLEIGYYRQGWSNEILLGRSLTDQELNYTYRLDSPFLELSGLKTKLSFDVTRVTDVRGNLLHDKVSMGGQLSDSYDLSIFALNWNMRPEEVWVRDLGFSGQVQSDLWLETNLNSSWQIGLGYGRTDSWGVELPDHLALMGQRDYISGKLAFSERNILDEGWDVAVSGKYDLENRQFSQGNLEITRSYDCFEVSSNLDIIDIEIDLGFKLKY